MTLKMDLDETKQKLSECGFDIKSESRRPDNHGTRLDLTNGAVVNVFDNGSVNVQGKKTEQVEACLAGNTTTVLNVAPAPDNNKVFVVYGHDESAKKSLELLLLRWELKPIFMDKLPAEGQTIIEKLEKYTENVHYAIVLATPDDDGYRKCRPKEKKSRARQNVVLELGMMLAKLGRAHVAILLKEAQAMEKPSDIDGLLYIPFTDDVEEVKLRLAQELEAAGFSISLDKV